MQTEEESEDQELRELMDRMNGSEGGLAAPMPASFVRDVEDALGVVFSPPLRTFLRQSSGLQLDGGEFLNPSAIEPLWRRLLDEKQITSDLIPLVELETMVHCIRVRRRGQSAPGDEGAIFAVDLEHSPEPLAFLHGSLKGYLLQALEAQDEESGWEKKLSQPFNINEVHALLQSTLGQRYLSLAHRPVPTEVLARALAVHEVRTLHALSLANVQLDSEGLGLLLHHENLPALQSLSVIQPRAQLSSLADKSRTTLQALKALSLRDWRLSSADVETMVEHLRLLDRLGSLELVDVAFDAGAAWTLLSSLPAGLEELTLVRCGLSDDDLEPLLRLEFSRLRCMNLHGNELTDVTARALAGQTKLISLRDALLTGNRISPEGLELIKESLSPRRNAGSPEARMDPLHEGLRLLDFLIDQNLLVLGSARTPDDLAPAVGDILAGDGSPSQKACHLEDLLLEHEAVEDLFAESEALEALLTNW